MSESEKPSLADSFRMVADLIDKHPEMADWFPFPDLSWHAQDAAHLDLLAAALDVDVYHRDPHEDGTQYSHAEKKVGVCKVHLQAYTSDYEKATGKTAFTAKQLAEAEHWSKTPFADESGKDGAQ